MTEPGRGWFINFEGVDGCGKSTQMKLLARRLREAGREVVETVEPGGTRIGNQIRAILLDPANGEMFPIAEMLLYFAARAQNVDEVILPALKQGKIVLSDRFTDSTMAYQGLGRGLGEEAVMALDGVACRGLKPDLTILIDIDLATSLTRSRERSGADRMEDQAVEFHQRVRAAYLQMAAREPGRFRLIDGRGEVEAVAQEIWRRIEAARGDRAAP
jgi:dTMP kinase